MDNRFWKKVHSIPVQNEYFDIESINPAEAARKQGEAINEAGPLYGALERLEHEHARLERVTEEVKTRVLAQNMPVPSSSTRTNDLVDAFVLSKCETFKMPDGTIKDISEKYLRLRRRRAEVESKMRRVEKRIRALEALADKCDRIMNWAKHEARLER